MPLKNLTIDKTKATEELIESIIKPYIRYDTNSKSIFFLPEAEELNNIKKTLIFLTALKGWKFITKEPISWEAKPDTIAKNTGIKGNTLRPMLSGLKERKILIARSGKYSVPDYNIRRVKSILEGEGFPAVKSVWKEKKTKKQKKSISKSALPRISKKQFETLINSDWFNTKKTLNEIKQKFHELGTIVPATSLPPYLLKAIREGKLKRKKEVIKGKKVWVYSKKIRILIHE